MDKKRIKSRKRQAILDYLCSTDEHPSAEMIYNKLKPHIPELSLGTVYRNLAVLEEDGLVIRVGSVDGQERYDGRVHQHAHFVCEKCRRVLDIAFSENPNTFLSEISGLPDFEATSYSLTFHGICSDCKNK